MVFLENQIALELFARRICVRAASLGVFVFAVLIPGHASAQVGPTRWSLYALGGYSVALPGEPIAKKGSDGGFRSWSVSVGSVPYVFSLTDIKGDDAKLPPDVLLGQCVAGLLSSVKGVINSERDLLFEGWPGVEIRYSQDPALMGVMRVFVVKDKIVSLIVTHAVGFSEPEGLNRYFGSIKLPSDVPKGTLVTAGPVLETYNLENSGFSAKVPEGAKAGTSTINEGNVSVQMHRFATAFLNRVYMGIVIDPPDAAKRDLDEDTTGKAAQAVNAYLASQFNAAIAKTDSRSTALGKAWIATFVLGHGLTGRFETYVKNNHTYSLLAIAPESFMDSDEVKGFFDSATLPGKR